MPLLTRRISTATTSDGYLLNLPMVAMSSEMNHVVWPYEDYVLHTGAFVRPGGHLSFTVVATCCRPIQVLPARAQRRPE